MHIYRYFPLSYRFTSVAQLCTALGDSMDCGMPDFPVHHQRLERSQSQVHQVEDAIQPSCPLQSPSPPAFNLSQHQGKFFPTSESVLCMRWPKYWSFSISPFSEYSGLISFRTGLISLLSKIKCTEVSFCTIHDCCI